MTKISLKFVFLRGKFSLCATVCRTTIRHYKTLEKFKNVDFTTWNKKTQRFESRRPIDRENNKILDEILGYYQKIIDTHDFSNGKELFDFEAKQSHNQSKKEILPEPVPDSSETNVKTVKPKLSLISRKPQANSEEITLKEFLESVIHEIKYPSRLKPSASYQGYLTLLHKLEQENKIIKLPLSAINDDTFVQFIRWLNKQPCKNGKGNNFIGTMKVFTATLNRARKARLISYVPDFPYMDYAPVHKVTDKAKDFLADGGAIKSLTEDQYAQFVSMNLDCIEIKGGPQMVYYKELYRDFCMLLYEMRSRPIDILRLHWDNLAVDPNTGRYTCTYIPAKKKNYGASSKHSSKALVIQYLTPEAVRIVLKYKGKSKGGYIFPFPLNDIRWDFNNPQDFHYHYYNGNHICGRINKFLHRVGKYLQLPYQLTMYAFRRTAITKAVTDNIMPIAMVAKTSGTSVEMIEAHYANYLHALSAY